MATNGSEGGGLFPKIKPADDALAADAMDLENAVSVDFTPNVNENAHFHTERANTSPRGSQEIDEESLNSDTGIQDIFRAYQNRHREEERGEEREERKRDKGEDLENFSNQGRFFPKIEPFYTKASSKSTLLLSSDQGYDLADAKDWDQHSISLDSQILQALASRDDFKDFQKNSANKFPYVAWYKAAARDQGDTESLGLLHLDEYGRFLEMTKLNQRIGDKLACSREKPLHVLDALEFQQYHENNLENVISEPGQPRRRPSSSWHRSKRPFAAFSLKNGHYLHRSLKVRHLQMISLGGTLGVGLYLNSGKALSMAGGFGTLLAFVLVGILVLATVNSFCEMVTFVSVVDGVSGLSSRFVDESFGFATGWLYFFSFSLGLAGEVVASIIILSYFPNTRIGIHEGATAGFTTLFLAVCFVCNMIPVLIFGEIEYLCSLFKVIITLGGIIVMIIINRGAMGDQGVLGFKYWQHLQSEFEKNIIFGLFRPAFDLSNSGMDTRAIGGNLGRFLSLLTAVNVAAYAYSGTEIVCIAACEAKDPRKALPSATKRVFWRILLFYCLALFVVSLNVYAGDPRLLRYYSGTMAISASEIDTNSVVQYVGGVGCNYRVSAYGLLGSGAQSPWIVAFQSVGLCSWSVFSNICLFIFALSCGNSHLYVSSRTLFSLALQNMAPSFLKRCNRYGTPYYAVIFSILPALLSYTCVKRLSTIVFQNLTSVISATGVFVWFAMCLCFVRFYYGLQKRPDTMARDDKAYPYKLPLQPYLAILGVFGSAAVLLSMGFVVFLRGYWNVMFFFSSYGALMVFAVLYVGHRLVKGPSFLHLEALDFDSGRREHDIYVWDGGREYNIRSFKDMSHKIAHMIA